MKHKKKCDESLRICPDENICPAYDATGAKLFDVPDREEMGVCVIDNFPEEHIQ